MQKWLVVDQFGNKLGEFYDKFSADQYAQNIPGASVVPG